MGLQLTVPNISFLGSLYCATGVGKELISSLVNTELKCLFNSYAIYTTKWTDA